MLSLSVLSLSGLFGPQRIRGQELLSAVLMMAVMIGALLLVYRAIAPEPVAAHQTQAAQR